MQLLPEERIETLNRSGQKIIQNSAAPCFSLDALLLADFIKRHGPAADAPLRFADLGTGTGIIALLLAAYYPHSLGKGLELMPQMAQMAGRSVALNGLEDRLQVVEGDLRNVARLSALAKGAFDLVCANPPYGRLGEGKVSADPLMAAAKSEVHANLADCLHAAAYLLAPGGLFFLVHRPKRLAEALALCLEQGLAPRFLRMVQPFAEKEANHFLLAAQKGGRKDLLVLPPLIVYGASGDYAAEAATILQHPFAEKEEDSV